MTSLILKLILDNQDWLAIPRSLYLHQAVCDVTRNKVFGDMVEFGCRAGGSAMLIQAILDEEQDKERILHVYDSFAGFPEPTAYDDLRHKKGDLACSEIELLSNFTQHGLIHPVVHKGWFTYAKTPEHIAFAHIDADLYDSTLAALRLTYAKMRRGAIIVIDDWNCDRFPGVKAACDLFFQGLPETVLPAAENQGIVQKQ
jgi:hypothetical protein